VFASPARLNPALDTGRDCVCRRLLERQGMSGLKRILNSQEEWTHERLRAVCEGWGARVYAKLALRTSCRLREAVSQTKSSVLRSGLTSTSW
jgi:hypothetical protein